MAFEIFTRKLRRSGTPSVTFSKLGRMQFNKLATSMFEKDAVENVLLLWDTDRNLVGVRPITKKDSRAYKLHYGEKGNGAGFSAKTFFDYIGVDYSESKSYGIEAGDGDILMTFQIPDECFAKKRQQHLVLEPPKRGKSA